MRIGEFSGQVVTIGWVIALLVLVVVVVLMIIGGIDIKVGGLLAALALARLL